MFCYFGNLIQGGTFYKGGTEFRKTGPRQAEALGDSDIYKLRAGDSIEFGDCVLVQLL